MSWIQTKPTEGQLIRDTSPYEESECSLAIAKLVFNFGNCLGESVWPDEPFTSNLQQQIISQQRIIWSKVG